MRKLAYLTVGMSFFLFVSKVAGATYMATVSWPMAIFAPLVIYALGVGALGMMLGTLVLVACLAMGSEDTFRQIRKSITKA